MAKRGNEAGDDHTYESSRFIPLEKYFEGYQPQVRRQGGKWDTLRVKHLSFALVVIVGSLLVFYDFLSPRPGKHEEVPQNHARQETGTESQLNKILEYYEKKDYPSIIQAYEKEKEQLDSSNYQNSSKYLFYYAEALYHTGKQQEAFEIYTQYLSEYPEGEFSDECLNKLEEHRIVSRPKTGTNIFGSKIYGGHCQLEVINYSGKDAVVKVVRIVGNHEQNVRDFYIRDGSAYTSNRLPPGTYVLKIAYGNHWHSGAKRFLFDQSYSVTDVFELKEYFDYYGTSCSRISITLHRVVDGNLSLTDTNEESFYK